MNAKRSTTTSKRSPRRTKQGFHPSLVTDDVHERIAMRAYGIDEQRIRQGALEDWLQAERAILGHNQPWNAYIPPRGGYGAQEQE